MAGEWLTEKAGPLPRWGWLAAGVGAGALFLVLRSRKSTAAPATGLVPSSQPWPTISGGGTALDGGSSTVTPTPTPVGPAQAPTGVSYSQAQWDALTNVYEQAVAQLMTLQMNGTPAPAAPAASTPQSYGVLNPAPSAGLQSPTQVPAYIVPQNPGPPVLPPGYTMGGAQWGGSGLFGGGSQLITQAPQGSGGLVQYVGGPLNGQWLNSVSSGVQRLVQYIGGPLNGQWGPG